MKVLATVFPLLDKKAISFLTTKKKLFVGLITGILILLLVVISPSFPDNKISWLGIMLALFSSALVVFPTETHL